MKRFKALKVMVPVQLLVALLQAGTGFAFIISHALKATVPHWIIPFHMWNGILLVGLVLVHVGLNWSWLMMAYMKQKEAPAEIGIKAA
jgi:hypothetical protein